MAFGQTREQEAVKKDTAAETTEEKKGFAWPWIPIKGGTADKHGNVVTVNGGLRKIRLLPALDAHGNLIEVPLTDRNGKVVPGKMTTVPETEVRFMEILWKVIVSGKESWRRIWVDWEEPGRWDNPFWEMAKGTEKGSDERKAYKEHFLVNVFDKSFVVFDDNGYPTYADENGDFVINAFGKRLKDAVKGDPEPLNQIRILQGTSGRTNPPGKHFFQKFVGMLGTVENPDNPKFVYNIHEFDISINVKGAGVSTERAVNPTLNLKPLPDEVIFAPRYNLVEWCKPWPNDAVQDVLDGKDYYEVLEKYGITEYPQLKSVRPADEEVPFDESVPAESVVDFKKLAGKKVNKKAAAEEESEELFD